jgi:glycerophosphoryl diester phosphodiesterase
VQFLFSEVTEQIIERLIADGIDADVYFRALNEQTVKVLHAAGRKINCWTVDTKEDAERLVAMGVDYITTNILE